jgi:hypothetical protein
MTFGGADLLFNQVEVVQQPLAGGCDGTIGHHRFGEQVAYEQQHAFVFGKARQQLVARARSRHLMRQRQGLAVLQHLVRAE